MKTARFLIAFVTVVCLGINAPTRGDFIACDEAVLYLLHETPTDPESAVVFAVKLELEAADSDETSIGWEITLAEFRQPGDGGPADTVWVENTPVVDSPDGLWWCDHADFLDPQLSEFDMPPLLVGTADAEDPEEADLDYSFEGVTYEPPPGGPPYDPSAGLTYVFTKVGFEDPEEEGEDEVGEIDEEEEPPGPTRVHDPDESGHVDGLDIQLFVKGLITSEVDINEAPCFIVVLLGGECECPRPGLYDCNGNDINDETDIFLGTSEDCNDNGIPDECEIDEKSEAPGGPFFCTENCDPDCNENGLPDGCEEDCNENGVPDDCDIADETSNDVNKNGVPDECEQDCNENGVPDDWDVSQGTSDDCNEDGVPDECEPDCNENGVPDDCDVDPSDPDGNEEVSEDCNENGLPDECDMALPMFPSLDCNENGVPDECDLADCAGDPACDDCNENGFLDECDIAGGVSLDENSNGIPDECEGVRDGGGKGEGGESEDDAGEKGDVCPEETWAEFYDWCLQQETWGPDADRSTGEQFQAVVDMLGELGLPLQNPFLLPPA